MADATILQLEMKKRQYCGDGSDEQQPSSSREPGAVGSKSSNGFKTATFQVIQKYNPWAVPPSRPG
eukprot:scaffold101589_cov36-Cyclotella_meneghiniana.AAC.8